jgi:two-component system NtrC family sensor kinase
MGSLLAGVSHELNNPLAIVMGRASLLEEKCEGHPALLQDAVRIREAAERCGRIVRTFLNMARSRPPRRERVMLNDVVRAAADMLGYAYRSHGIELRLELDPALPALSADADQICQVLLNLLVNAQHALASSDGARWVRVRSGAELRAPERRAGPRNLWLEVADNGPGIAESARARIFEAFFTTKAEGIGTGMGLAVSRSLAREHGGELELQPAAAEGGGAVFRLTLPIGARIDDGTLADAAAEADGGAADESDDPTPERVLVVDDEAELSRVMREMLEQGGYEVATAESGEVALELLGAARFDAVVSDLRMPDMDGTALWRAIGERHPTLATRLLFVTGDTLSPDAAAFLSTSGCAVLDKPFAKADLLARVAALMRRPAAVR